MDVSSEMRTGARGPELAELPASVTPSPLRTPIMMALVVMGGVALTVCLQGRWRDTPWMVAGVLLAFGSHELTKLLFPPDGSPCLATFLLRWPSSSIVARTRSTTLFFKFRYLRCSW
jgi:hypothetical protein